MTRPSTAAVATIGIDIGKNVFHLIGLDERGAIATETKASVTTPQKRQCEPGIESYAEGI